MFNWFGTRKPRAINTEDDLRAVLRDDLMSLAYATSGIPVASLDRDALPSDLYIRANGRDVGYLQHMTWLNGSPGIVEIGHIAVDTDLVGRGVGCALAVGFAKVLIRDVQATGIHFSEGNLDEHVKLFKALNAKPVPNRKRPASQNPPPDWLWMFPSPLPVCAKRETRMAATRP